MRSHQPYTDREDAGRLLARELERFRETPRLLVLGLPRGGVPVAAEVAEGMDAELDVVMVRKVGVPHQPEFAMGAIAAVGGTLEVVWNREVVDQVATEQVFNDAVALERVELDRREREYRWDRPPIEIAGRTVIVVDDGLATGATMRAALVAVRALNPEELVAAVPVSLGNALAGVRELADDAVCPWISTDLHAVGQAYRHFEQTTDTEVRRLLGTDPDA